MIFQRSLLREFGSYAAAVFSVLFAIVVTSQLVRMLARAAGGKIPSDAIFALIGFTALNYLPILLALTLFVSVLMAVSRSYRDSEMVVWSASGLPLTAWVRPVLIFAAPIVLVITAARAVPDAVGERAGRRVSPQPREPRGRVADRAGRVPRILERRAGVLRRGRRRPGGRRPQRVHREQPARPQRRDGEPRGVHRDRAERRPLRRAAEGAPVRGRAGHGRIPSVRVRPLRRADQAARGEGGVAAAADRLHARAARVVRPARCARS